MSSRIEHTGTIEAINGNTIHVRILQSSACAGCKVAGHCSAAESKEKTIDVYDANAHEYNVGENVELYTDAHVGYMAEIYAFGIPFILVIAVLMIMLAATGSEALSAAGALAVLIPYYLIIYLLRNKIARQVYFHIEKT